MKLRKSLKRIQARQKDYDQNLSGKSGYKRPGSDKR